MQAQAITASTEVPAASELTIDSPQSYRLYAVRELAYLDFADDTDSTGLVVDMCRRFPGEAITYIDAYIDAYRYALSVANGSAQ